ncbi:hypothetical protein P170DRAFT_480200 [Aspergillus steynii IBT 23096]|uniref:Uncharacterized protein n=1 Tax=Aspergillus steynii IBT 23096 TaxID=1392250 RepID=A0A2I2FUY5_9EURO|nr:uncharacterized protein P170DRAFT_480200 [Aspergillus steynii IBT 23096]PLB44434.1 hypothetical protein P170DRAFT_480200 [Aspergillus steynii IBT 23096]
MKSIALILSLAGMSMASVCGSLNVTSQADFDAQAADCTIVNGDLEIASSFSDDYADSHKITVITGSLIARNLSLMSVFIPALTTIGGDFELTGTFYDPSFPSLMNIRGDFMIASEQGIYCSNFDNLRNSEGLQGKFECVGDIEEQ